MTGRYGLYGLVIASEIDLAWTRPPAERAPDIAIRRGCLPPGATGDDFLQFDVPGVATYRMAGGAEIVVDAAPGADADSVRLFLMGSAMGVLLHQRGLLVLHANAVNVDGAAILFMGTSGAGKSSLAAWFAAQGYPVLSDDVCPLDVGEDGPIVVLPGVARLRLDDAAGRHFAVVDGDSTACPQTGKYDVAMGDSHQPTALPVGAIYLIGVQEGVTGLSVAPLVGLPALDALMANTYRGFALPALGGSQRHLHQCLRLTRSIQCFRVDREKDWARFDAFAHDLLAHVCANQLNGK